jgi:hypothetical protein
MALCGFNKEMLDSLLGFCLALFRQIPKRALEDKLSIEESVRQELLEMNTFLGTLKNSNKDVRFLTGVTLMAQSLYSQCLDTAENNSLQEIEQRYKAVAFDEVAFCAAVDEEYYGVLRPNAFDPHEALKQLQPWIELNKK